MKIALQVCGRHLALYLQERILEVYSKVLLFQKGLYPEQECRLAETRAIHLSDVIPEVDHRHLVFGLPKKIGLRQRTDRLFRT